MSLAEPVARVRHRAVAAQVEVPPVVVLVEPELVHLRTHTAVNHHPDRATWTRRRASERAPWRATKQPRHGGAPNRTRRRARAAACRGGSSPVVAIARRVVPVRRGGATGDCCAPPADCSPTADGGRDSGATVPPVCAFRPPWEFAFRSRYRTSDLRPLNRPLALGVSVAFPSSSLTLLEHERTLAASTSNRSSRCEPPISSPTPGTSRSIAATVCATRVPRAIEPSARW